MSSNSCRSDNAVERRLNFQAVYKSSFFIERSHVPSPIPSQNYHYHNCYELYYLYSGDRYYFIKDKTYHVESGSLVLIKPYEIHCTANFAQYGYDRLLINFKEDFIKELITSCNEAKPLECFEKNIHTIILNPKEKQFVESLLETMTSEKEKDNFCDDTYLKFSLVQLLLFINKVRHNSVSDIHSYANSTHKTISEITGYINNHYNENITLDTIADLFYISPCYFSRTFKRLCGIPFSEYLNNVRVKEACKLLYKTDMNITSVAEAVGFGSNAHFDRVFKNFSACTTYARTQIRRPRQKDGTKYL